MAACGNRIVSLDVLPPFCAAQFVRGFGCKKCIAERNGSWELSFRLAVNQIVNFVKTKQRIVSFGWGFLNRAERTVITILHYTAIDAASGRH